MAAAVGARAASRVKILGEMATLNKNAAAANLAENRVDLIGSQVTQSRMNVFRTFVSMVTKPFRMLGGVMFDGKNPIAHYVALALVLLLLAGGLTYMLTAKSSKKGGFSSLTSNPYNVFTRTFAKLLPGYRSRLMAKSVTPFSGVIPSTDRPTIAGRCDNLTMREYSGGLCGRTTRPEKIRWVIDSASMPELEKISPLLKSKIAGENREKFMVYIPWKEEGVDYSPDCSQATFSDGTSASKLLTNTSADVCTKKYIARLPVSTTQYRPLNLEGNPNYRGLDTYASENNPMC